MITQSMKVKESTNQQSAFSLKYQEFESLILSKYKLHYGKKFHTLLFFSNLFILRLVVSTVPPLNTLQNPL